MSAYLVAAIFTWSPMSRPINPSYKHRFIIYILVHVMHSYVRTRISRICSCVMMVWLAFPTFTHFIANIYNVKHEYHDIRIHPVYTLTVLLIARTRYTSPKLPLPNIFSTIYNTVFVEWLMTSCPSEKADAGSSMYIHIYNARMQYWTIQQGYIPGYEAEIDDEDELDAARLLVSFAK